MTKSISKANRSWSLKPHPPHRRVALLIKGHSPTDLTLKKPLLLFPKKQLEKKLLWETWYQHMMLTTVPISWKPEICFSFPHSRGSVSLRNESRAKQLPAFHSKPLRRKVLSVELFHRLASSEEIAGQFNVETVSNHCSPSDCFSEEKRPSSERSFMKWSMLEIDGRLPKKPFVDPSWLLQPGVVATTPIHFRASSYYWLSKMSRWLQTEVYIRRFTSSRP